jgi:hypothetical protein
MIELLRFDSRSPGAKFSGLVDLAKSCLATVPVIEHRNPVSVLPAVPIAIPHEWFARSSDSLFQFGDAAPRKVAKRLHGSPVRVSAGEIAMPYTKNDS